MTYPGHSDMSDIERCSNCRGLCPPGDVDETGVCTDCREISARVAAAATPKPVPYDRHDLREPWWNRD